MTPPRLLRTLTAAILAAGLLTAPVARAANLEFGYVDSARIFREYKEAQEAQARFDRQMQGWRDEAAEKERLVQQLRNEVRDQGPILSSLKRQEKEESLQRAISDSERFIQEIWGPNGKATQENERMTNEIVNRIRAVVEKLADERGLTLVLDAASGYLLFVDKSFDITADVLLELNEGVVLPGGTDDQ